MLPDDIAGITTLYSAPWWRIWAQSPDTLTAALARVIADLIDDNEEEWESVIRELGAVRAESARLAESVGALTEDLRVEREARAEERRAEAARRERLLTLTPERAYEKITGLPWGALGAEERATWTRVIEGDAC